MLLYLFTLTWKFVRQSVLDVGVYYDWSRTVHPTILSDKQFAFAGFILISLYR